MVNLKLNLNLPVRSGGALTHRSKQKPNASKTQRGICSSTTKLESRAIVKEIKIYFRKNPTCLKRNSDLDLEKQISSSLERRMLNRRESFLSSFPSLQQYVERSKSPPKGDAKLTDTSVYNLTSCIEEHTKPYFGYKLMSFEPKNKLAISQITQEITASQREEVISDHVLKCFTFGKQVKRDSPPPKIKQAKFVKEINRKFDAVDVIRKNSQ